jgi:glycosyltransferase involved in cell wall biosynthesis
MKCRVLYVVGQLGAGGLEHQLCWLLQSMDRERYQPQVVVWNFNPDDTYVAEIRKLGVPIHSFPAIFDRRAKLLALRRMTMRIRPEVIHSYSFYTNVAAWWAALGTDTVAVGSVRSDFTNDKRASGLLLGNSSARWPRAQIFNSYAGAEAARNAHSVFAPKHVMVVPNGLDLQQYRSTPLSTNGAALIVGIGSLIEVKRWDRLLDGAAWLKERALGFSVNIAGSGPLRGALEKRARQLGIADRIQFSGQVKDVPGLLSRSTILAHTSDTEGRPNVVMEAMACGRAVVAMEAGDIASLVEDGKTGFVVRRGDDGQLVDRLATLITRRELCVQLGKASRAKAEKEFGLRQLVDGTLAAYRAAGWRDS